MYSEFTYKIDRKTLISPKTACCRQGVKFLVIRPRTKVALWRNNDDHVVRVNLRPETR